MWPLSGAAREQLAQSHTAVSRVDVLHDGRWVYTLEVDTGSVGAEAGRPAMRNMAATLIDPTGALSGGDIDDLLSPYTCEVAPWRGMLVPTAQEIGIASIPTAGFGLQPFGTSAFGGAAIVTTRRLLWGAEHAPLGVFGLTSRKVSGDGSVDIVGQDRAMTYQGDMSGSLAIPSNTPVETAIQRLLVTRNRSLQMRTWKTGFTVGPLLYQPDIDVWVEALKLAQSVGGTLFHDRTGELVFAPAVPTSGVPVARFAEGDGLLLDLDRTEDSDTIRNVVVVTSTKTATGGVIKGIAEDTDPTSPTFAGGKYGRRVKSITNEHVSSVAQAQQAAAAELARELGRSETVTFSAVVNPALDPLDVVGVHRPSADLINRGLVIETIDIPLGAEDTMRITCRKSILTRDGQVLDVPDEMTAA